MRFFQPVRIELVPLILLVVGLCYLSFAGGMLWQRYELPGAAIVTEGIEGAEALDETLKEKNKAAFKTPESAEAILKEKMAKPVVTGSQEDAYAGYTLLTFRYSSTIYLVDMQGQVVHSWHLPFSRIWPAATHVHTWAPFSTDIEGAEISPDGDLTIEYTGRGDTPYGYGLARLDKNSQPVWTFDDNAHHDFYIDSNGVIYTLVHRILKTPDDPADKTTHYPVLADYIVLLSPEGKELQRISLIDAFRRSKYASLITGVNRTWDLLHANSIMKLEPEWKDRFPMFRPGQILVSLRSIDALAVIDPEKRKVVWAQQGPWDGQHAARFLSDGTIGVLNNHAQSTKPHGSTVMKLNPETGQARVFFPADDLTRFHTALRGRIRELPNRNLLVVESGHQVFEVRPDGKVVWQYGWQKSRSDRSGPLAITSAVRYTKADLPFLEPSARPHRD